MKPLTLFIPFLLLTMQISWADPQKQQKQSTTESLNKRAGRLKLLYAKATGSAHNYKLYQPQFFNEFPSTFREFDALYGYRNGTAAPLYHEAESHIIGLFNSMEVVNDTLYYNKLISIAIGGEWDADAVNFFQGKLGDRVCKNMALTVYLLDKLPIEKVRSFWFFYFDGVHPKKQIEPCLRPLADSNPAMYKIIVEAKRKVIAKWGKDGHGD